MKLIVHNSAIALTALFTALAGVVACTDSNNPPAQSDSTGGTGTTTNTSTGGAVTGVGGTSTASATGGTTSATGQGGATASGGATAAYGGGTALGGAAATGGATGASGNTFAPLCSTLTTVAGVAPTKGGACTDADSPLCYKTCGPRSVGYKSETCTAGVYAEQSGCSFPAVDYTCYKIPTPLPDATTCGLTTLAPQAGQACTAPECTLCQLNGQYLDSSTAAKAGYCVCQPASATGTRTWSCASTTAWPCPGNTGC